MTITFSTTHPNAGNELHAASLGFSVEIDILSAHSWGRRRRRRRERRHESDSKCPKVPAEPHLGGPSVEQQFHALADVVCKTIEQRG